MRLVLDQKIPDDLTDQEMRELIESSRSHAEAINDSQFHGEASTDVPSVHVHVSNDSYNCDDCRELSRDGVS